MVTQVDSVTIYDDFWFDLREFTGRDSNRIPARLMRDWDRLTHVDSFFAETGDWACDPRLGGIAGNVNIAPFYGVRDQQFRKNIAPSVDYLRRVGDIWVTNVNSASAHGEEYQKKMRRGRCERLGIGRGMCDKG